jgi:hypothetical protein
MKIVKIYCDKKSGKLLIVVEGGGVFLEVPRSWDLNQLKEWLR